jgi:hypothetical protein
MIERILDKYYKKKLMYYIEHHGTFMINNLVVKFEEELGTILIKIKHNALKEDRYEFLFHINEKDIFFYLCNIKILDEKIAENTKAYLEYNKCNVI